MNIAIVSSMVLISYSTLLISMAIAEALFTLMFLSSIVVFAYTIGRYNYDQCFSR